MATDSLKTLCCRAVKLDKVKQKQILCDIAVKLRFKDLSYLPRENDSNWHLILQKMLQTLVSLTHIRIS